MNQFRWFATGATGKVYFLNEGDFITASHSIQGNAGARDTTADHKHVEMLATQAGEIVHAHCWR